MRNPLQDQLLKAGLVKKSKVAEVVRDQARQRKAKGKGTAASEAGGDAVTATTAIDAQHLQAEKARRDRELAAERNAQARARELRAQVQQLVAAHRVAIGGDIAYRFVDGDAIRQIWVDGGTRAQLARGSLVIVRDADGPAVVPRAAAERIRERDASAIVVDHGGAGDGTAATDEDPYYAAFPVPDDLDW